MRRQRRADSDSFAIQDSRVSAVFLLGFLSTFLFFSLLFFSFLFVKDLGPCERVIVDEVFETLFRVKIFRWESRDSKYPALSETA